MTRPMQTTLMFSTIVLALSLAAIANSAQAADLDSYGGFTDIKGEKTGFFHTDHASSLPEPCYNISGP